MRLNKEDWNQLDDLLTKMGFGSYYDCVEVLKNIILDLDEKVYDKLVEKNESDIHVLIMLISHITGKLKNEN